MTFIDLYKSAFIATNKTTAIWDSWTLLFYYCIFITAILLSIRSFRYHRMGIRSKETLTFRFIFFSLCIVLAARGQFVGMDTPMYRQIFQEAVSYRAFIDSDMEPGFLWLTTILHHILPNDVTYVFLLSSLTIYLVAKTIWRYKDCIYTPVSVMMYCALFYFQAFSLMRIYLAASITLYFINYLQKGMFLRYAIIILLVTLFVHFSTMVLILPLIIYICYRIKPNITFVGCVILLLLVIPLSNYFIDYMNIARYSQYIKNGIESGGELGLMAYFDFIPSMILLWKYRKERNSQYYSLLFAFAVTGYFMKILAYHLPVIGRVQVFFMPLYLIILPYFILKIRNETKRTYKLLNIYLVFFACTKLHYYFYEYLSIDAIMPYYMCFFD